MSDIDDFSPAAVQALAEADVAPARADDLRGGHLTAELIPPTPRTRPRLQAREAAVLCGRPWVEATLRALDPGATATWHVAEGGRCAADQVVLDMEGSARALLSAERTLLNF